MSDHFVSQQDRAAKPAAAEILPPDWFRDGAALNFALDALIMNLGTISACPIPYARLARRLSQYAKKFPLWGDISDQSPRSLLKLPAFGVVAVGALIEAGAQAVRIAQYVQSAGPLGVEAATALMMSRLDDDDQILLTRRVCALHPANHADVAVELGVNPSSVHRAVLRAVARIRELLVDPAHREVLEHVEALRGRLGPLLTCEVLELELCRIGLHSGSPTAELLLYLAGPYALRNDWIEVLTPSGGGYDVVHATVTDVLAKHTAPTTRQLTQSLVMQGISPGLAITYLREVTALRCFGDVWVPWPEAGVCNQAEALLHALGVPVTMEILDQELRAAGVRNLSSLSRAISDDDRFVRTSRYNWALRDWRLLEYTGLIDAIEQRIDAAGGQAKTTDIIRDILAAFPDVTESSIRTYSGTLAFILENGMVRRRTEADPWPTIQPLYTARSGYRSGHGEIRFTMPVNRDLLRGSGLPVPQPVAYSAGVSPGQRRTFSGANGEITVYWDLTSIPGAVVGSLRAQADAVDASEGDDLVLTLRASDDSFEVARCRKGETAEARLRKLLGRSANNPVAALAASLECPSERVAQILQNRGEYGILDLISRSAG